MRIASLLAGSTEILCGLGLGPRIVAISHECDYPADILDRPRVTSARIDATAPSASIDKQVRACQEKSEPLYSLDIDLLASLKPELIITQAHCDVCAISYDDVARAVQNTPRLRGARIIALNPASLDAILHDIKTLGDAAGAGDAANRWIAQLRLRIAHIREVCAKLPRRRVACLEWIDPLMISGNWMPGLIEIAGGHCALVSIGQRSRLISWGELQQFDPETVLVMPCGFNLDRAITESAMLRDLPGWSSMTAVTNRQVFAADGNAYFNRSGPRIVDSLELLAALLHSPHFDEISTRMSQAWRRL